MWPRWISPLINHKRLQEPLVLAKGAGTDKKLSPLPPKTSEIILLCVSFETEIVNDNERQKEFIRMNSELSDGESNPDLPRTVVWMTSGNHDH